MTKSRRRYHGKHFRDSAWKFYGLVVALPMLVVLAVVGFSALPPYTPSQAQAQPTTLGVAATVTPLPSASPSPSVTPSPVPTAQVYEAERGTLGSGVRSRPVTNASGGLVVTHVGRGTPTGDVTLRVTVPAAGRYPVTVYYLLVDRVPHRLALSVDGAAPQTLAFPPLPTATTIGALPTVLTLAAGANTLRFSGTAPTYGPDLDRITVLPETR